VIPETCSYDWYTPHVGHPTPQSLLPKSSSSKSSVPQPFACAAPLPWCAPETYQTPLRLPPNPSLAHHMPLSRRSASGVGFIISALSGHVGRGVYRFDGGSDEGHAPQEFIRAGRGRTGALGTRLAPQPRACQRPASHHPRARARSAGPRSPHPSVESTPHRRRTPGGAGPQNPERTISSVRRRLTRCRKTTCAGTGCGTCDRTTSTSCATSSGGKRASGWWTCSPASSRSARVR